jgi:hypothetical protein
MILSRKATFSSKVGVGDAVLKGIDVVTGVVAVGSVFVVCVPQQATKMDSITAHPNFVEFPDNLFKTSFDWWASFSQVGRAL